MKHIIGVDTGTNSIGWTLIEENDNHQIKLVDIGTYIFSIGTNVDDKSQAETTKNEQRRLYRGAKRNLFRYKLRRKKLMSILKSLDMKPNFKKLIKQKNKCQSMDLYKLRSDAIKKQIPLDEIGRIFILLNKHRGFKSNAKKQILEDEKEKKEQKEETKKVDNGINQLEELIVNSGAKTIGEYFYLMHKKANELYQKDKWHNPNELIDERALNEGEIILYNSRGIRRQFGRYTARDMYLREFDLIWETQKNLYDKTHPNIFTGSKKEYEEIRKLKCDDKQKQLKKFKKTNYWLIRNYCIYFQRPLKSQRKFVSNCQFETNKKVIPTSSPLYQEFRIWKNISDLRYNCEKEDIQNQPLPYEWKIIIADYLKTNEKIYISKPTKGKINKDNTYIIDLLKDVTKSTSIKSEDDETEKYIKGNLTYTAFFKSLGKEKFEQLEKENKLEKLWHHLHMAKDDDWLKDILQCKWMFNDDQTKNLLYFELENEHGSYSSKVISKILPFMKNGYDEYSSLSLAGYTNSNNKEKVKIILKDNITQLKYQELRNPVVEKSVSQVIKIVNAILKKYKKVIDRNNFEIRIESTRQLKKPRNERERMLREIRDKDKVRQEYADFLNKKREEGILRFNRIIEKYDSIVNKFELWLEMGMDKDDPKFSEFQKIIKKGDNDKHRLWLECNRICPYTGKTIGLVKLFSSDIEIEHIIPLSRSLDNSFNNKTITFSSINKEKGNRTAYEYMYWKNELDIFKKRIKDSTNRFPKSKQEQFQNSEVKSDFTNDQISNVSYIAKYVRKKMTEVCHENKVQFTNGSATAELRKHDWRLSDLLDKIRFEEETGIDIDLHFKNFIYLKKDFIVWYQNQNDSNDKRINFQTIEDKFIDDFDKETDNNILECLNKIKEFNTFRNKSGKKDRSDHRHHAIDSFIIACCSPSITKYLSTYNRIREENGISLYDELGNLNRSLVDKPFDYEELKQNVKNILVYHNIKQKLINSRINNHKTCEGAKKQKTFAPQGALHKDGIYGKLKEPFKQGIYKNDVYVKRIPLFTENEVAFSETKDLDKVVDKNVKEILERRIKKYGDGKKAFNKEAIEKDPLYMYSTKKYSDGSNISKKGKPLPVIKNVRVINKNSRNLIPLPAKDEEGLIINKNRYAETEGNYIMALYELTEKNKKGETKVIRDFRLISFYEAVNRKRKGEKLFNDIVKKGDKYLPLMKNCHWLKQGDLITLYENEDEKDKILLNDKQFIIPRLYKVTELNRQVNIINRETGKENEFGVIKLSHTSKLKTSSQSYTTNGYYIKVLHSGIKAIKVRLDCLGNIEKIGEECFI
jgi:CRISPR-associated endonuclease Csn1